MYELPEFSMLSVWDFQRYDTQLNESTPYSPQWLQKLYALCLLYGPFRNRVYLAACEKVIKIDI